MFRIVQELDFEEVDDELLDVTDLTIGYVEDEFFAQEFCAIYENCKYEPVIPIKYPIYLTSNMVEDETDVGLLKIPYRKYEE